MTKQKIKELAKISFQNGQLANESVETIANHLKRSELKTYIKELRRLENSMTVVVTLPRPPKKEEEALLKSVFAQKNIVYVIDPGIITGINVVDNDIVYAYDIKSALDTVLSDITNSL